MEETVSNERQIVSLKLRAPVSDREKERLSALLESKIAESGRIRLLLLLEDYPAPDSAETLFEDIRFIRLHAKGIERMAVLGDRAWQDTWIAIFGLFGRLETAYFDRMDMKKAGIWLRR